MKDIQCNGIWWLPDQPDQKIAGTLSFSNNSGLILELSGALGDTTNVFAEKTNAIILGSTWDCALGPLITLRQCNKIGTSLNIPGILRERYLCNSLYSGGHLEQDQSFLFTAVTFQFSKLASWARGLTGLSTNLESENAGVRQYQIRWSQPKSISGPISGGLMRIGIGIRTEGHLRRRCVEEMVQLQIVLEKELTLEDIQRIYILPLRDFLTLGTNHPNALTDLSVSASNAETYKVLIPQTFYEESIVDLLPHKMLFTLNDFQDRITELVERWLEVSERLKDVRIPYFGLQHKPDAYVDVKFLIILQCLAVYEKSKSSNGDKRLQSVFNTLLDQHWEVIGSVFGTSPEKAAQEIVELRNHTVHPSSLTGESIDYSYELFWMTEKLMFLMKSCLLDELGISAYDRQKLFNRNQFYLHIVSL